MRRNELNSEMAALIREINVVRQPQPPHDHAAGTWRKQLQQMIKMVRDPVTINNPQTPRPLHFAHKPSQRAAHERVTPTNSLFMVDHMARFTPAFVVLSSPGLDPPPGTLRRRCMACRKYHPIAASTAETIDDMRRVGQMYIVVCFDCYTVIHASSSHRPVQPGGAKASRARLGLTGADQ